MSRSSATDVRHYADCSISFFPSPSVLSAQYQGKIRHGCRWCLVATATAMAVLAALVTESGANLLPKSESGGSTVTEGVVHKG